MLVAQEIQNAEFKDTDLIFFSLHRSGWDHIKNRRFPAARPVHQALLTY